MFLSAFAQSKQNVHSNEQIIAAEQSNNSALHISHSVFISSKNLFPLNSIFILINCFYSKIVDSTLRKNTVKYHNYKLREK